MLSRKVVRVWRAFSIEEIREAAFMREALEVAAVEKVARDHTPDQYAKLARNVRLQAMLVEDHDTAGFYQADEEFHALLMEFTGFPAWPPRWRRLR